MVIKDTGGFIYEVNISYFIILITCRCTFLLLLLLLILPLKLLIILEATAAPTTAAPTTAEPTTAAPTTEEGMYIYEISYVNSLRQSVFR